MNLRRLGALGAILVLWPVALRAEPAVTLRAPPALTLADAIKLALENNQNIKVEAFAPQITRADVLQALGQFDPSINFSRSYLRQYSTPDTPVPLTIELVEEDTYKLSLQGVLPTGLQYSLGGQAQNARGPGNGFAGDYSSFAGINLTQPLLRGFGFGANLVNVRVARANHAISQWQYRQTLIDTVTSVIDTYSELVLAHDELRIAISSRDLAGQLYTENQKRLRAGGVARADVTSAHATMAGREEAILVEANAVRAIENQLRELIGEKSFPPDRPLLTIESPAPVDVTTHPDRDYETALNQRPDYQAARLGITINRAQESAARNQLLPQVNVVAGYGYNGLASTFAASRHMVETEDFPSSSIGMNVSIPITNAQARGAARAARLTREQSEANLHNLEADIAVAVANAASQIETTRQRVAADQIARQLASQALDDEVKKLSDGTTTTLAVIQQQQQLNSAEISLAAALDSQRQAVAAYDRTLGTTLERYHVELSVN